MTMVDVIQYVIENPSSDLAGGPIVCANCGCAAENILVTEIE